MAAYTQASCAKQCRVCLYTHSCHDDQCVPYSRNQLVHEVQVRLIWDIALSTEHLVVGTLHKLLLKLCGMLDVGFLLNLPSSKCCDVHLSDFFATCQYELNMHRASLTSFTTAYFKHTTLQYIELQQPDHATSLHSDFGSDKGICTIIVRLAITCWGISSSSV